jgi:hypothetical protein
MFMGHQLLLLVDSSVYSLYHRSTSDYKIQHTIPELIQFNSPVEAIQWLLFLFRIGGKLGSTLRWSMGYPHLKCSWFNWELQIQLETLS